MTDNRTSKAVEELVAWAKEVSDTGLIVSTGRVEAIAQKYQRMEGALRYVVDCYEVHHDPLNSADVAQCKEALSFDPLTHD